MSSAQEKATVVKAALSDGAVMVDTVTFDADGFLLHSGYVAFVEALEGCSTSLRPAAVPVFAASGAY